eukprot:1326860-Rhodomonas_salina.2
MAPNTNFATDNQVTDNCRWLIACNASRVQECWVVDLSRTPSRGVSDLSARERIRPEFVGTQVPSPYIPQPPKLHTVPPEH